MVLQLQLRMGLMVRHATASRTDHFATGPQLMTTARPLDQVPDSDSGWAWLASAAEMAVQSHPALLSPASAGPGQQACFPLLATRTPGPDLAAVGPARRFARATLQRWDVTDRCDDVTLVLSELLTNALRYAPPRPGGWPVRFGLMLPWPGSAILCAVSDPSGDPPVPGQAGPDSECGRGLHVVEELSDWWGYTPPGQQGKVVWAAFTVADHPAGRC
jgi:hypothetical protein